MTAREQWAEVAKKYPVSEETINYTQANIDSGGKPVHTMSLEQNRQVFDVDFPNSQKPVDFDGSIEQKIVPSSYSKEGIPINIYKPSCKKSVPAIVIHFHGGGLIIGTCRTYENVVKLLAMQSGAIVVNVEYRRLPNATDPLAPFNDCQTATHWVLENKEALGGCAESKVGVGGDSAGGQLTSSVLNDVSGLDFSFMIYPVADLDQTVPSFQDFMDIPAFCGKDMAMMFNLTNPAIPNVESNPRVNPAARTNLGSAPPLLIILAQLDPLKDWGLSFAEKMKAAGREVKVSEYEGVPHGFCIFIEKFPESSARAFKEIVELINRFQK